MVLSQAKVVDTLNIDLPHPRTVTNMHVVEYAAKVLNLLTHS